MTTPRLVIRALKSTDLQSVFGILGCKRTTAGVSWGKDSIEDAEQWLRRRIDDEKKLGYSMWGLVTEPHGIVGMCGFFQHEEGLELGYVVRAEHQGIGLATEAATAVVSAAKAAGQVVIATIRPVNTASIRVAEAAGLVPTDEKWDSSKGLIVFR